MIEKIGYIEQEIMYFVFCDEKCCSFKAEIEEIDFNRLLEVLKERGWMFKKNGWEWEHYCPDCCRKKSIK